MGASTFNLFWHSLIKAFLLICHPSVFVHIWNLEANESSLLNFPFLFSLDFSSALQPVAVALCHYPLGFNSTNQPVSTFGAALLMRNTYIHKSWICHTNAGHCGTVSQKLECMAVLCCICIIMCPVALKQLPFQWRLFDSVSLFWTCTRSRIYIYI